MRHTPTVEEIQELAGQLRPAQLLVLPFYHELENEIRNPDRVRLQTEYFWKQWAPKLGPTLTVLVITLRSFCYYNKLTKETRDWCFPQQETLAREIGVSSKTVLRELQKPLAASFIRRVPQYRYDGPTRKTVRTADLYHVAMDDPIAPEDTGRLVVLAAERLLRERNPPGMRHEQRLPPKSPIGTQEAVPIWDRKALPLRRTENISVNAGGTFTEEGRDARLDGLARGLADELADRKSLGFPLPYPLHHLKKAPGSPRATRGWKGVRR